MFERITKATIERGEMGDDGSFSAILATEGEASDGHILSIRGLKLPSQMPLLFGHSSTPDIPTLGSIKGGTKTKVDGVPALRVRPKINTNGDDPLADVRRGIHQLVADGDLNAMSIRWNGDGTPRRNLPSNHPHFVDAKKVDFGDPRYSGLFFAKADALEGSIVAIGADPGALMGRSQAAESEAERIFFRQLAEDARDGDGLAAMNTALDALRDALDICRTAGMNDEDIVNALALEQDQELHEYQFEGGRILIPGSALIAIQAREIEALTLLRELESRAHEDKSREVVVLTGDEPEREISIEESKLTPTKREPTLAELLGRGEFLSEFERLVEEGRRELVFNITGRK